MMEKPIVPQAGPAPGPRGGLGRAGEPETKISLILRLGSSDSDNEAWVRFVTQYGPLLETWCRQWQRRLGLGDSEDMVQAVHAKLLAALKNFDYDRNKSFRGWLRTLTDNVVKDLARAEGRQPRAAGGDVELDCLDASESLQKRLETMFDTERLAAALEAVRASAGAARFEIFEKVELGGLSVAEVAEALNIPRARVHMACFEVRRRLREHLARLEAADRE